MVLLVLLALQGSYSIIAFMGHIFVLFHQTTGQHLDKRGLLWTSDLQQMGDCLLSDTMTHSKRCCL